MYLVLSTYKKPIQEPKMGFFAYTFLAVLLPHPRTHPKEKCVFAILPLTFGKKYITFGN